ncbi:Ulp1-like peptidase [Cucumis melo var. makuwa]|uniref:Ulp1-like peptidase n=1 Tax=Cucumis melo var. makuwa TaxID=1194695 RepID=A0A5A7SNZ3_CUCMM|nr:Ulp1-like peptidase [Cucumis melo var. makuwa]
MLRKILFGHFLDVKLMFNGLLCRYILLREVDNKQDDVISFKLLSQKGSIRREDFDTIELDKERVKGALRENVVMHKKKLPETYSLYGFPFTFQVWTDETVSTISAWVGSHNRASHDAIPRIMQWSCTYSPRLKTHIQAIELTDEELAYLDQVLDIPSTDGYKDNPAAPLQEDDSPYSHPHGPI